MRHATDAYRTVAKEIASPRELEASLLLKAAARLQAVSDGWERDKSDFSEALTYNRKLWTIFLDAITSPDNPLPAEIRQNIANLGVFCRISAGSGLSGLVMASRQMVQSLRL